MVILENNFGKIRCDICDSVFTLEKGDLKSPSQDPGEYYFECPVCGYQKWIPEDHDYIKLNKFGAIPHK